VISRIGLHEGSGAALSAAEKPGVAEFVTGKIGSMMQQ
jgi:hypothetical protein